MKSGSENFRVIGCVPYSNDPPGFALPIFCNSISQSSKFIQYIDEISFKISQFKMVQYEEANFLRLSGEKVASCGEDPIFAFIDNHKQIYCGTLVQIEKALLEYEVKNPKEVAIALQIRELLGTQEEKRILRKRFRNAIYDLNDTSAANFFVEDSVLKTELWGLLVRFSPSERITQLVLSRRSSIYVRIENNHNVVFETNFLVDIGYPINVLNEINQILQLEFNNTFAVELDNQRSIQAEISADHEIYENLIRILLKSSRQEERAAILLRILSEDFDLGKKVLSVYNNDRGKFASLAIRKMSSLMIDNRPEEIGNDRLTETIFEQLYKECFPMNKGAFLYLFARHFSQNYRISNSILKKLTVVKSRYVEEWKHRIYNELNQKSPKIYSNEYFNQTDIFQVSSAKSSKNQENL